MKMLQSTPFLLFDGNCAEAMNFYHECLGGELTLTKLGETPMREQFPVEKHERIINARLKNGSVDISATDWMASPGLEPRQGNMFSIYLTSQSLQALEAAFAKLSDGADKDKRTFIELHNMPFGSYGQFTDRFGVDSYHTGKRLIKRIKVSKEAEIPDSSCEYLKDKIDVSKIAFVISCFKEAKEK